MTTDLSQTEAARPARPARPPAAGSENSAAASPTPTPTPDADGSPVQVDFTQYPPRSVARAFLRLFWLQRFWQLIAPTDGKDRTRQTVRERVTEEAKARDPGLNIGPSSLKAWENKYRRLEKAGFPGVLGLIDAYRCNRRVTAGMVSAGSGERYRSPEAAAYFLARLFGRNRLSVERCHNLTLQAAQQCGWLWPRSSKPVRAWLLRIGADEPDGPGGPDSNAPPEASADESPATPPPPGRTPGHDANAKGND